MTSVSKLLFLIAISSALLGAVPVPKASDNPAKNLAHYLQYQMGGDVALSCREGKEAFSCESRDQKIIETDCNATTVTAFKYAGLHFNGAVAAALQKERFDAAMKEIEQTEQLRKKYLASKKPYLVPPSSPLQDALDRALFGNLEKLRVDGLDVEKSAPQSHMSVKKLVFVNAMKRTAKGAAFSERILGEMRLSYTDAVVDKNRTESLYRSLPVMLEARLETNNTIRAAYVGEKLEQLYGQQIRLPMSGEFTVKTRYLGNDAIGVTVAAENGNKKGTHSSFGFAGNLLNASTVFTPARKPLTPGTPDFLFGYLHSHSSTDGNGYRALLKTDKRFARYIGEYDALIRGYFDRKLQKYRYSAVLSGWITQAKNALSKGILGKADTLDVTVRNRDGMTAMQVFGMLIEQLMATPPDRGAQPDAEKIIADTAASHLEVEIEAH